MNPPKFKIGEIVRYATGPTALFRINTVLMDNTTGNHRYYGMHCMGGGHYADEYKLKPALQKDIQEWTRQAQWRRQP